jgi:hypothetical protein
MEDGRKVWAPKPDGHYYPTLIIGTCKNCKRVSEIEFRADFNFKMGDRVMDRKPIPAFCEACKTQTEFIPLPEEIQRGMNVLANLQNERLEEAGITKEEAGIARLEEP